MYSIYFKKTEDRSQKIEDGLSKAIGSNIGPRLSAHGARERPKDIRPP
jgi:hypothetical protein